MIILIILVATTNKFFLLVVQDVMIENTTFTSHLYRYRNHELGWLLKDLSASKQQLQAGLSFKLILIALALYNILIVPIN